MVVVLDAVVQLLHVEHLEEGEVLEEAGNHARHEGLQRPRRWVSVEFPQVSAMKVCSLIYRLVRNKGPVLISISRAELSRNLATFLLLNPVRDGVKANFMILS